MTRLYPLHRCFTSLHIIHQQRYMIPCQHLFHRHTSLQVSTQFAGIVKVLCMNQWLQLVLSNASEKFMQLGNSLIFAMHLQNSFIFATHPRNSFIFIMHLCNSCILAWMQSVHLWNSCMLPLDADTEDATAIATHQIRSDRLSQKLAIGNIAIEACWKQQLCGWSWDDLATPF
jgi:hypothetical protein